MRSIISSAAMLLCTFTAHTAFAEQAVGTRDITIHSTARGKDLSVTVWYPSDGKGEKVNVGENRIFEGAPAIKDAAIQPDRQPLVLLSHGSGSRAIGMAWIATALAEAGFIVAAPDHPGTTSGDSTPADTPKIWERTDDISTIITSLTRDATWSKSIDANRIGVLGFSLGGSTAIELAGARANLGAYAQYCVDYATSMDCQWFSGGRGFKNDEQIKVPKLDLHTVDKARFEQSNHDDRIRTAVLVDPGLEVAFTQESLRTIDIPLTFINLGSVGKIPVSVLSDQLAKDVPDATYMQVDESDHFSFLPVCKNGAAELLKSIGEVDPICEPGGRRDRSDIHKELVRMIVDAFQTTLKAVN
ncbi:alpha/beta hydrolase family protein [Agrobacterium sp. rho-13.3]|uniref:alpha/beta hydrolase family protein n=1 Tax=Agrobacterium sp. rho-13.3 TaxID=3072980 RepID=UPI002A0BE3AB|nr:alpha/beta fold hydrolase [Agrobacterium sp. rho-13.3]MDX8309707.1 alpha/beta fold hydrolase [Agrobacterium sp. rho-13.3]